MSDGDCCAPFSRDRLVGLDPEAFGGSDFDPLPSEAFASFQGDVERLQQEVERGLGGVTEGRVERVMRSIVCGDAPPFAPGITVGDRWRGGEISHRFLRGRFHIRQGITLEGLRRNGL